MIISKIYDGLNDKQKKDIAFGLACGLVFGLVFGLACGLAFGLACGLAFGLACGLACGLAGGLAFGLACGLADGLVFGLVFGLATGVLSPLWLFVPAILILAEILFYFDGKKLQEGQNKYWFTFERKAEAIFETLLIVVNGMNVWVLSKQIDFYKILMENCHLIATAVFWLGVVAVGITALAVWIWLNSLKYKEQKQEQKHKEAKQNPFTKSEEWREKHRKSMLKYWRKKKSKLKK